MADIDFPSSPDPSDQYTFNGITFEWNGTFWELYCAPTTANTFPALTDTPAAYTDYGTYFVTVRADELALEFADIAFDGNALDLAPDASGDRITQINLHSDDVNTNSAILIRAAGEDGALGVTQYGAGNVEFTLDASAEIRWNAEALLRGSQDETVSGDWLYTTEFPITLQNATLTDPVRVRWHREDTLGDYYSFRVNLTDAGYGRLILDEKTDSNFDTLAENILTLELRPGAILRTDYGPSGTDPYAPGLILNHRTGGATWLGEDIYHTGNLVDPALQGSPNVYTAINAFDADVSITASLTLDGGGSFKLQNGASVYGSMLRQPSYPGFDIRAHDGTIGTYSTLKLTYNGDLTWKADKIWTAGNDGAGSTLDADLLDGLQGSSYYSTSNYTIYPAEQYGLVVNNASYAATNKTALEAAIAAAGATNRNGVVLLPPGLIYVAFGGGIELPRNVKIQGQGNRPRGTANYAGSTFLPTANTTYCFKQTTGTNIDNCELRDFGIEDNGYTITTAIYAAFTKTLIQGVNISVESGGSIGTGIHIYYNGQFGSNHIKRCHIRQCGVGLYNECGDSRFVYNYFNDNTIGQINYWRGGAGCSMIGNFYDITSCTHGLIMRSVAGAGQAGSIISQNQFQSNTGILLDDTTSTQCMGNHQIHDNRFSVCTVADIDWQDQAGISVQGNFHDGYNAGPTPVGIKLTNVGHGIIIGELFDTGYTAEIGGTWDTGNVPAINCYTMPNVTGAADDPVLIT